MRIYTNLGIRRRLDGLRGSGDTPTQPQAVEAEPAANPLARDIDFYYSSDEDGERAEATALLLAEIRQRGIRVIVGGGHVEHRVRLNVRQPDVKPSLQAVVELFGADRIWVQYRRRWEQLTVGGELDRVLVNSEIVDALLLDEPLAQASAETPSGAAATGVWLEFVSWVEKDGAYGRSYLETSRPSAVAKRLRSASFDRLADEHHHLGQDLPSADIPDFPVDIVYTWVDGDDPEWRAKKHAAQDGLGVENTAGSVLSEERFRSRDELKYSLRSVEKFAPWVRTIHIVTAGQRPEWLNTDHPQIRLVDHSDIYLDADWLPTFNSSGIETQLHHVPDLAEKFLYFNDDFFLGEHCKPSDFFYGNGVIKYFPSGQMAYEHDIDETSEEYIQADKNAIQLLSAEFGSMNRHIMQHVPYPSDRSVLQELEDTFPEEFAACAREPFRSSSDLRPIAFMQYHYGFHRAKAMPSRISHRYFALWKDSVVEQLNSVLEARGKKTFCINDVGLQPERTEEVNDAVINFLESYFPNPSAFEK